MPWVSVRLILGLLICALFVPCLTTRASAQSDPVSLVRHHVIFLFDASGSNLDIFKGNYPASLAEYRRAVREDLLPILRDGQRNGFGIPIYDEREDLSTAYTFGLPRETPFFDPDRPGSFIQPVWFQERGRTVDDLVRAVPTVGLYWTAYNSAFTQSVRKTRSTLERADGGVRSRAFRRTFLVMVSDGNGNGEESPYEIRNIHGKARELHPYAELRQDGRGAEEFYNRLIGRYSLRSAEGAGENAATGPGLSAGRFFRVVIRELLPQRDVSLTDLLTTRPNQSTELRRSGYDRYRGDVRIEPAPTHPIDGASFQMVALSVRKPGSTQWEEAPVPVPGKPFSHLVDLARAEVGGSELHYKAYFVRRDALYGQAVQEFTDVIRFRGEPAKRILSVLPIPDWMMALFGDVSQDNIVVVGDVSSIAMMLAVAFFLFLPKPRAAVALEPLDNNGPIAVDFNVSDRQGSGYLVLLNVLRFHNGARRQIPFWGRTLPRLAERKFGAALRVVPEFPSSIDAADGVVGLGMAVEKEKSLTRLSEGAEQSLVLSTGQLFDYDGPTEQPVPCKVTIEAEQTTRLLWLFTRRRRLEDVSTEFLLRMIPEEPSVEGRFVPGRPEVLTGQVARRPLPAGIGVPAWLTVPHTRGRRQVDAEAAPDLVLELRNAARHQCARPAHVKVSAVMYPVSDHSKTYPIQIPAGEDVQRDLVPARERSGWLRRIGLHLDYESLPLPGDTGEDYIVSATLEPVGQEWGTRVVTFGVRLGPDERRAALRVRVGRAQGKRQIWDSYQPAVDGEVFETTLNERLLWSAGKIRAEQGIVAIELDNMARSGDGAVVVTLRPGANVQPAPLADPTLEPAYESAREQMIRVREGDDEISLGTATQWTIENERSSSERPILLRVRFNPHALTSMDEPRYSYCCELAFDTRVRSAETDQVRTHSFVLRLLFEVELNTGDDVLAVDFGTSAVVAAFASGLIEIAGRTIHRDFSDATLDLAKRHRDLLQQWSRSGDLDLRNEGEWGTDETRHEHQAAFLPSPMALRPGQRAGEAAFVLLPVSRRRMALEWDRIVYYLKGMILRADPVVPNPGFGTSSQFRWIDRQGNEHSEPPKVDDVIQSAYRALVDSYVRPMLRVDSREHRLARMIVAHPNSFTISHIRRLRDVLQTTFPKFLELWFLSESNAVLLYCEQTPARFFRDAPQPGQHRHVLVYDIGAGTLDITLSRIEWLPENPDSELRKKVHVLFKIGLPVAGNKLDEAIARVIDARVRSLVDRLRPLGVTLDYKNPIVAPHESDPLSYSVRMVRLKQAIHRFKVDLSTAGPRDVVRFDINVSGDILFQLGVLTKSDTADLRQVLDGLGLAYLDRGTTEERLSIPFSRDDVFGHPEVEQWLRTVTDDILADLGAALRTLSIRPQIDTLILSGRTALFPPLRRRLMDSIRTHLGLSEADFLCPELSVNEKKEAVALGSLLFALYHGRDLQVLDRNIWARYGVVYHTSVGQRFQEFFGYSTQQEASDKREHDRGLTTILFKRTHELKRTSGEIQIVATFSHNPEAHLRDPSLFRQNFVVLHTIGGKELPDGPVKIRMSNEKDDTIVVVVNPGLLDKVYALKGVRPDGEHLAQLDWPYKPLEAGRAAPVPLPMTVDSDEPVALA